MEGHHRESENERVIVLLQNHQKSQVPLEWFPTSDSGALLEVGVGETRPAFPSLGLGLRRQWCGWWLPEGGGA